MSEQIKFLDANGVKILWDKISMQDYPNNATLMAVINAIDATKANKDELPQPLIGAVNAITPNQVLLAMLKGEPIAITYTDEVLGVCTFNHFTYNSILNSVIASFNLSQQSDTYYVELSGLLDTNTWTFNLTPEEVKDVVVAPSTAKVGQTIIVKSIDENGKPTSWEAVDNIRYVASDTEPDDKSVVWIDTSDFDGDFNQVLVDSTLTQIGHAADAKTTGDAINQLTSVCDGLKKIYISDVAPSDTTDGTIWVDTSEL